MLRCILATILRRRPQEAAANKWNKLLQSLDFWVVGMSPCGGMLLTLFKKDCCWVLKTPHLPRITLGSRWYRRPLCFFLLLFLFCLRGGVQYKD